MPKYYARIGNFKMVLSAKDAIHAANKAIVKASVKCGSCPTAKITKISEVGFDLEEENANPDHKQDETFMTKVLYKKLMDTKKKPEK